MQNKRGGKPNVGMETGVSDLRGTLRLVGDTQRQLNELVNSVTLLTTAVRVIETRLEDDERRVGIIENEATKQRDRGTSTADQRQVGLMILAIQAFVSVLFVLLAHVWR